MDKARERELFKDVYAFEGFLEKWINDLTEVNEIAGTLFRNAESLKAAGHREESKSSIHSAIIVGLFVKAINHANSELNLLSASAADEIAAHIFCHKPESPSQAPSTGS